MKFLDRVRIISRTVRIMVMIILTSILTACYHLHESDMSTFGPSQEFEPRDNWGKQPFPPYDSIPPEQGPCVDKDKAVVATCVQITGTITVLSETHLYVAEKMTSSVVEYENKKRLRTVIRFTAPDHSPATLLDYTISPEYQTNHLIYALIKTSHDVELVKASSDGEIKPIIANIPDNVSSGAVHFIGERLYVALNSGSFNGGFNEDNPAGIAGNLFYITDLSENSTQAPTVIFHGLQGRLGMCFSDDSKTVYITSHTKIHDDVTSFPADDKDNKDVSPKTIWSWSSPPGISGCVIEKDKLLITEMENSNITQLTLGKDGLVSQQPHDILGNKYGHIYKITRDPHFGIYIGTANLADVPKAQSDDRVVRIKVSNAGDGSSRA